MLDYAKLGRMKAAAIRELQDRALARVIGELVYPYHRYYGRLMDEAGLGPPDLADTDALIRLPFTDRETVWHWCRQEGDPRAFCVEVPGTVPPPRRGLFTTRRPPAEMAAAPSRPLRVMFAGGRTTPLTPVLFTGHDLERLAEAGRRILQVTGVNAGRPLVNAVPYGPSLPFWQVAAATLDQGITTVQAGGPRVMDADKTLTALVNTEAATLTGYPGFLTHVLQSGAVAGVRLPRLERVLVTGEPLTAGSRARLAGALAAVGSAATVLGLYLSTEAKTGWAECAPGTGYHTNPDLDFLEIVDPAGGERLAPGATGELVITHLDARGTFLLRYRTGDVIEGGLTAEPCPVCGRTVPRLGALAYPAAEAGLATLRQALDAEAAIDCWQVTVTAGGVDVALSPPEVDGDALRRRLDGGPALGRVEALPLAELRHRLGTESECRETRIVFPGDGRRV